MTNLLGEEATSWGPEYFFSSVAAVGSSDKNSIWPITWIIYVVMVLSVRCKLFTTQHFASPKNRTDDVSLHNPTESSFRLQQQVALKESQTLEEEAGWFIIFLLELNEWVKRSRWDDRESNMNTWSVTSRSPQSRPRNHQDHFSWD